jgi:hypothetical protein
MLIEKPLSLCTLGTSVAIIIPEVSLIASNADREPSLFLVIAAILGGTGVYLGTSVALSFSELFGRIVRLTIWSISAILISLLIGFCVFRAAHFWQKAIFFVGSCLPMLGLIVATLHRQKRIFFIISLSILYFFTSTGPGIQFQ